MELTQTLCAKHHGGLRRIRLYDASKVVAAHYKTSAGCYSSLTVEEGYEPIEVAFAEQSASWSESANGEGVVEHRVEFTLSGGRCGALGELLELSEGGGVVAEVECAAGDVWLVGYSPRATTDYPLRLQSAHHTTHSLRADKPSVEVVLRSLDGWASHPAGWSLQ